MSLQQQQECLTLGHAALEKWMNKYKDQIEDSGGSVAENTLVLNKKGVNEVPNQVGAFFVIKAQSQAEAAEIFSDHPHFAIFPGDSIELTERRSRNE